MTCSRKISPFLIALIIMLPTGFSNAQEKPFFHSGLASEAKRYEQSMKRLWNPGDRTASVWRRTADLAFKAGNVRQAVAALSKSVMRDRSHSATWRKLAEALLLLEPANSNERYNLPTNASSAAYQAYLQAKTGTDQVAALNVLARALVRRSYWRPALMAYKSSLKLADDPATRKAYEELLASHGFRILDYNVASDSATPRLCIKFSDPVAKGNVNFEQYVSINGKDPASLSTENNQICIDGLKHGQRYQVAVRAGLPSSIDETLLKTAELSVYVRDRSPSVRFTGRNYVLPNKGQQGIPLTSINTKKLNIDIYRVGDRALAGSLLRGNIGRSMSRYDLNELEENTGQKIWHGDMKVTSKLNREVTSAFPVSQAVPDLKPGVYMMVAEPADKTREQWKQRATQWFIVSDLGLTSFTSSDGLHAFVRSLASAEPGSNVKLRLIARNNEVLGELTSNAMGYVRFDPGLTRGKGAMSPAILMAESKSGDYAFLDLTNSAFDLTDRGEKGRTAPGPLDAYVFTERGVYKPGADVHVTALLRDHTGKAAERTPLTMIMTRPDGVEHARLTLTDEGLGGRATTIALANTAMTGTWRLRMHADPKADPIGEASFLVEDFVPERLELKLDAKTPRLAPDATGQVNVNGRYLYGPAAGDLALEGEIVIRPRKKGPRNFSDYHVGIDTEEFSPLRKNLRGLPRTNSRGQASVPLKMPAIPATSRLLEANLTLRLREPGGRAIERALTLPIDAKRRMIGIRPLFKKGELSEDSDAGFNIVMIGEDGSQIAAKGLKWELQRIERHYQWYSRNGSWNYEPVSFSRRVANGKIDALASGAAKISRKLGWGRYRLEVATDDPSGPVTSVSFNAGWWGGGEGSDTPEILDIALDKKEHKTGDVARLSIQTKGAGKALVAIIGNGLQDMKLIDVPAGGTVVPLKIAPKWAPGAYVTTLFYRPLDIKAKRMPSRSIGVKWLDLDSKPRTVGIEMKLPEKVESASGLSIPIKLSGLGADKDARIVVAAVDVGILNLTRYKTPAPESWFYAQRKMGTEIRDLYGRLIDGMKAGSAAIRSGGDAGPAGMSMQGSPPVEAPLALFSGIVPVASDGTANVSFDLPEFNGTVRIMAVAWSRNKLGHAEHDIIVRDPVAILASGPRFLTLGDKARLRFDIHNVEGQSGTYKLNLKQHAADGSESEILNRDVALKPGEKINITQSIDARRTGEAIYAIHLTGPGNIDITRNIGLHVSPMAPDIKRRTIANLKSAGGKLVISKDILGDLIPEKSLVSVSVGPSAGLDVPGLLVALDRYPYGCAEQITSRALPLLYLNQVAANAGITGEAEAQKRITKAIARLFEMQNSNGAFGLWGPGNSDLWLTAYVTDFLTRAKEQGHEVREAPMRHALDRLRNFVSYASDFKKGGEAIAYSLYVLARNGRAPIGDLRYYADARIANFSTPLAKAQIGAALAMYGDKARAQKAFDAALGELDDARQSHWRRDYGSGLRDGAATLTLISESGVGSSRLPGLTGLIATTRSQKGRTSTQEDAWMLLAARSLMETSKKVSLNINGRTHQGAFNKAFTLDELEGGPITIVNNGEGSLQAAITVTGAAETPEPPSSHGFRIERQFYTLDGAMVDLAGAAIAKNAIKQNDRFVVVLKVDQLEAKGGRVLLVDRLPAGLEIENPRLVSGATLRSLSWLKTSDTPRHSEFRKDRFTAAFDLYARSKKKKAAPITVAYMVRAVTPGAYKHPPATIEDMYRPERYARSRSGEVRIDAAD